MAKSQLPKINSGDSIYKVLSADYQGQISDSLRRFNQLTGGQVGRTTGTVNLIPPRTEGPEKILTAQLLGNLDAGIGTTYGYTTAAVEVQEFDYEAGRPDDQAAERRFEITSVDIVTKKIKIAGQHAAQFTDRHEVWLRDTEDMTDTRDGTYSVSSSENIVADDETEIELYEDIPSIIDPMTTEELIKGFIWLWTPFEHMYVTETKVLTDYRMVVNRSNASFSEGDLVNILWVDGEYIVLGSAAAVIRGYTRGGLGVASIDVDGILQPASGTLAKYANNGDGDWAYVSDVDLINYDETLTIADKVYCICFLDSNSGKYEPFPACSTTALTIPDAEE